METDRGPAHGERAGGRVRPAERTETYLFTDIEGSTRMLQRVGERFSDLLVEQSGNGSRRRCGPTLHGGRWIWWRRFGAR